MSEENARSLMTILRGVGCTPAEPVEIAQVQIWAEKNGFSEMLEDALVSAADLGWVEDGRPDDGRLVITPQGWENGNA